MLHRCLSIILMKPKQGFIFHVLLFFVRTAGKELVKVFLISALHRLHCQLSETPDQATQCKLEICETGNSCEIDHRAVERRWVVTPKVLVLKGLWGKERRWNQNSLEDAMGSRALQLPWARQQQGQACQGSGRAICSRATSCGEKSSSDSNKGTRKVR